MQEVTYYPEVRCEAKPGGLLPDAFTAVVRDVDGQTQFIQVNGGMINNRDGQTYLPVGIVKVDRRLRRALIEFPVEADSGANRVWVSFDALFKERSSKSEAVA